MQHFRFNLVFQFMFNVRTLMICTIYVVVYELVEQINKLSCVIKEICFSVFYKLKRLNFNFEIRQDILWEFFFLFKFFFNKSLHKCWKTSLYFNVGRQISNYTERAIRDWSSDIHLKTILNWMGLYEGHTEIFGIRVNGTN